MVSGPLTLWQTLLRSVSLCSNSISSQQLNLRILTNNHLFFPVWPYSRKLLPHAFPKDRCARFEAHRLCEEGMQTYSIHPLTVLMMTIMMVRTPCFQTIPLLQSGHCAAITLSQVQISCLLANAFFCTFPHRNTTASNAEYGRYPTINFTRWGQALYYVNAVSLLWVFPRS